MSQLIQATGSYKTHRSQIRCNFFKSENFLSHFYEKLHLCVTVHIPVLKQHVASHCVVSTVSSTQWHSIVDSWREHSDTVWLQIFHLCPLWTKILIKWQRPQEWFVNKSHDMEQKLQVDQTLYDNEPENSVFLTAVHLCTNRLAVFAIRLATCCATRLQLHFLHIQARVSGNVKHTGTKIKSVYKALTIKCLHTNLLNICLLIENNIGKKHSSYFPLI